MLHEKVAPQDKARRGRPKGSGIDDTTRLETIARMLAADPNLKPTTAIKNIGITDPSAIRRLRDKFHEFSAAQADVLGRKPVAAQPAPVVQAANVLPMPQQVAESAQAQRPRAVTAAGPAAARKVEPAKAKAQPIANETTKSDAPAVATAAAASTQSATTNPVNEPAAWLMMWAGLGIRLASTAVEAQLALGAQLFQAPTVAMALKGQIALNEMAMSIWKPLGPRVRTVH